MLSGLIMDYPLTLPVLVRRAEQLYGSREIVTRRADRSIHRYTNREMIARAKRLSLALERLGVRRGDRVGTLCWNHYRHVEAYFGIPLRGAVLHTLNLRLHPNDLGYIASHAGDRVLIVDESLLPLANQFRERAGFEHVIVVRETAAPLPPGCLDYEELLAGEDENDFEYVDFPEQSALAMCYTSGTTGQPKGVLYSHRAIVLHSLALAAVDAQGLSEHDTVLPVVPMFHANAWGMPFGCLMVGAKQVLPGPHLDPVSVVELLDSERVTLTGGVPTVWLGILNLLDANPGKYDLSSVRAMIVGGSAAPRSMIEGFLKRHNLNVVHAWGMTELAPMGSIAKLPPRLHGADHESQMAFRSKQGRPCPLIEVRARGEQGLVPWDGVSMGELEVRGPWVAREYFECPEGQRSFTDDGWFRTGDIVAIEPDGCLHLQDRAKDVIKSGGEWISSVALENALMGHPAVAEAAVVPADHPKWDERPLAVVVLKPGQQAAPDELRSFLSGQFAKWWLPDAFVYAEAIPRTSAGKFLKAELREKHRRHLIESGATQTAVQLEPEA